MKIFPIPAAAYARWDDKLKAAAKKNGVVDVGVFPGWMILKAMMWQESQLGTIKSVARGLAAPTDIEGSASYDKKSWGLMQVTWETAQDFRPGTTRAELNNPDLSIDLGSKIFARNQKKFPGNLEFQVRAYNGGLGFQKTTAGQRDTPIHWQKVKSYLDKIKANGG